MNNGHGLALALSIDQQQHKDFWQKSGKFSQLGTFCSMAAGEHAGRCLTLSKRFCSILLFVLPPNLGG